ncbi:cation diffusion facilitator family transporter [Methylobacter sp.]|uniref:cation diffusion facilitator family transporter n=1 Tax=Methylobacter sp. TaxID=2051955 RepID=UPI002FDCB350
MHTHILSLLEHEHDFYVINKKRERRTKQVLVLTFLTMILEIAAGILFGSMALLADGRHMGTHVAAFMIAIIAYRYSRVHAHDQTFAFSPGKVSVLGGYTSSVVLGIVALIMLIESGQRIAHPHIIHFNEAIAIAGFGLCINLISALLLKDYDHSHDHVHHHNFKSAYFHVQAFYAFPLGCNVRSGFKANNYEITSVERADLLSDYRAAKLHPIKRRQARGSAKPKISS